MAADELLDRILDPANRPDPYPLYAELRTTPVLRRLDGGYVVSTYRDVVALLHDPRVSSDPSNRLTAGGVRADENSELGPPRSFIAQDPPEHDRLRGLATCPFGPPTTPGRIEGMRPWVSEVASELIDRYAGRNRVDIVDEFTYPLPVSAICKVLGVPREDEPRFRQWSSALIEVLDPGTGTLPERLSRREQVDAELRGYLDQLAEVRRREPGDDMLSALVAGSGDCAGMSRPDLLATASLLLVAGHETTVNLIANGMLTLLRHPEVLDRLRYEPDLSAPLVEELLRYEPPVQFLPNRATLADIDVAGTTIPKGAPLTLMLAAANRDPDRFPDPDRFDPDRTDNQHLGFGNGIHYCFGAPLARVEAQIALPMLARRLRNPRLATDPPPYRPNPVLRGPRHLVVEYDTVVL